MTMTESEAPTEEDTPPPAASFAGDAVVIAVKEEDGDGEGKGKGFKADVAKGDFEKMCRICQLSPDRSLVQIGCGCKNELGTAHRHCAETWFRLRGNRYCEICGLNAKNITGDEDGSFIEEWYDNRSPSNLTQRNSSERATGCWRGQPFCNFLMACLVIAFILPWFFRINMF